MMAANRSNTQGYSSENDDSFSVYSEDFDRDSHSPSPENKRRNKPGNIRNGDVASYKSESSSSTIATSQESQHSVKQLTKSKQPKNTPHNATASATRKSWKSTSHSKNSKQQKLPLPKLDHVRARLLSAQRNRINTLNDELCETQTKLEQFVKENRLLKNLQYRQDKALRKFENTEGELPKLINRHLDDERVLKTRLRKAQESERRLETKLRDTTEDFQKMESTLQRLKKIVYDKNLGERSELAKQLNTAEGQLIEWERKNKELEKKVELTTQSFARQINGERAKHKETKQKLDTLEEEYRSIQAKLKEKERALEVSNIYALRSKPSPDKSLVGKMLVASPSRPSGKPSPMKASPLSITSSTYSMSTASTTEFPKPELPPPTDQPLLKAITSPNEVVERKKTVKSPVAGIFQDAREDSSLLDFGSPSKPESVSSKAGSFRSDATKNSKGKKERSEYMANRSVFLTANFDSPNSTFISDDAPSTSHTRSPLPPDNKTRHSPKPPTTVIAEMKKRSEEFEEERKKVEEERRQKAELLSRLKDLEEESNLTSSGDLNKSSEDDFHKLFTKDNYTKTKKPETKVVKQEKAYENNYKVENLHKGIPSTGDVSKALDHSEHEITFGGYAPTVTAPQKRKTRAHHSKHRPTPPGSESDEPLLDVASGKAKKPDLLQQLFGEQASKQVSKSDGPVKKENSFSSSRENSMIKTTPRNKPVHTGYPWERNVVPASQQGNGDGHRTKPKDGDPAFDDDDIEEVIL